MRGRFAGDDDFAAFLAVPGRNAMAPPQLARDAPIADVVHPFEISLGPVFGDELDVVRFDHGDSLLGERLHAHEPLRGEERLDDGLAAVAPADGQSVWLDFFQQAEALEIFDHAAAGLEAVEAGVGAGCGGHVAVFIDDLDARQIVAFAGLEIVGIVGRGDFDGAGAELRIGQIVEDDRDGTVHQRQIDSAAVEVVVARIFGVHGYGRIA